MAKKEKKNGSITATVDVPAPRAALSALEQRLATNVPLVVPRSSWDDETRWRVKSPSVVVRRDGRYGVARAARAGEITRRPDYTDGFSMSSGSSGFVHLPETFASRDEAERRAWALARELGETGDWP